MPCPNKGSHRHEKRKTGCLLDISSSRMFKIWLHLPYQTGASPDFPNYLILWSIAWSLKSWVVSFFFTSIIIKDEMLSTFYFPSQSLVHLLFSLSRSYFRFNSYFRLQWHHCNIILSPYLRFFCHLFSHTGQFPNNFSIIPFVDIIFLCLLQNPQQK